jgi:membrane protease YdiL (CAAX protease family)
MDQEVPAPSPARREWGEIALVMAVVLLGPFVALLQAIIEPHEAAKQLYTPISAALGSLVNTIEITAVVFFIVSRAPEGRSFFGLKPIKGADDLGTGMLWALLLVASATVMPWIVQTFFSLDPAPRPEAVRYFTAMRKGGIDIPLLTGAALILNSIAEEISMRGFLIPRLEKRLGTTPGAVVLSAVIFASYHLYQGWLPALNVLIVGLVFGVIFVRQRRVMPLIVAHTLVNIFLLATNRY